MCPEAYSSSSNYMQLYGAISVRILDVRFVSIVSRLGPDTLYLIVSRARFIDFRKLCISLYPDLIQIHCISVYPHVPAIVFNI